MRIQFPKGFQGRETNNIWHAPGRVYEFDRELAEMLIRDGRAVAVDVAGVEGFAEPTEALLGPMPDGNDAPVVLPEPKKRGRKRGAK